MFEFDDNLDEIINNEDNDIPIEKKTIGKKRKGYKVQIWNIILEEEWFVVFCGAWLFNVCELKF